MATVLDRPSSKDSVDEPSDDRLVIATASVPADADGWAWDDPDLEPPFPWVRLLLIGTFLGLGVGLPLIPFSDQLLAAFGAAAGALGCPFHPLPPDVR